MIWYKEIQNPTLGSLLSFQMEHRMNLYFSLLTLYFLDLGVQFYRKMALIALRLGFCQPLWQAQGSSFGVISQWLYPYLEAVMGCTHQISSGWKETRGALGLLLGFHRSGQVWSRSNVTISPSVCVKWISDSQQEDF